MTKLDLNFAAKLDTVIWALRAGNYIADDSSADTLRSIAADATELERAALAAGLHYGSFTSGSNTLKSTENIEIFFDTDNSNPTTPYTNWFRVSRGQDTLPLSQNARELFSVAWASTAFLGLNTQVTIGPRADHLTAVGTYPAILSVGSKLDVLSAYSIFTVSALSTGTILTTKGAYTIGCEGYCTMGATDFQFAAPNMSLSKVRGGWMNTTAGTQFYVGNDPSSGPGPQACIWEYLSTEDDWRIRMNDNTKEMCLFIAGSYPAYWDDPRGSLCIGGVPGQGNRDPKQVIFKAANYTNVHCLIVSPEINDRRMSLRTYHRAPAPPSNSHLVNFHALLNLDTIADDTIRLMSVSATGTGGDRIVFSVRSNETTYCPGGFSTLAADLAEYFVTSNDRSTYEPGTVMVDDEATGVPVPSNLVADSRVLGVMSTKPGLSLFDLKNISDEDANKTIPIALSGTVPTKVSTCEGSIRRMDLLVSGPNGHACKASSTPAPGTIIAKALEDFEQPGNEPVTGIIRCLVWKG